MKDMDAIAPVNPEKIYRLLNIGATTVVTASFEKDTDAMAAAWVTALDLVPAKVVAVIDKSHYTRKLMEKSGYFAVQLPTVSIAKTVIELGSSSKNDDAKKLEKTSAEFFYQEGFDIPLLKGCAAWMIFRIIPEAHNEKTYDLFIGECVAAWADSRVFRDGHYLFEKAPRDLRTLHYVAGGHFYAIGDAVDVE